MAIQVRLALAGTLGCGLQLLLVAAAGRGTGCLGSCVLACGALGCFALLVGECLGVCHVSVNFFPEISPAVRLRGR